MQRSLSSKLIISAAVALLIVSALALASLAALFQWGPQMLLRMELRENTEHVVKGLMFDQQGKFAGVALKHHLKYVYDALRDDAIYRVLDSRGNVLLASDGAKTPLAPNGQDFTLPSAPQTYFVRTDAGNILHVLTTPFVHDGQTLFIQTGRSERLHQALMGYDSASFGLAAILTVLVAMLIFVAVVWITFHRALRPLRIASDSASRIESNNLSARLSTAGIPKEVRPLIDAFNQALGRLELGYRAQQEFLATVAHELKTPLALIRGEIELGGLADSQLLLKDIDRMARQVHQLLHLAEVSDRKNFLFAEVDVAAVIGDAAEHLQRLADRVAISVMLVLPERPVLLLADGAALFVLLKNLLENALHHSLPGGHIVMTLEPDRLNVRDYGSGIVAEDLPYIYKRFWRGADRRDTGAGLGLAICSEIALAHGWTLTVLPMQNPGAEFVIAFR